MKNSEQRRDYKACSLHLHFWCGAVRHTTTDVSRETLQYRIFENVKTTTAIVSRETIAAVISNFRI
jgi:hypothetical protein